MNWQWLSSVTVSTVPGHLLLSITLPPVQHSRVPKSYSSDVQHRHALYRFITQSWYHTFMNRLIWEQEALLHIESTSREYLCQPNLCFQSKTDSESNVCQAQDHKTDSFIISLESRSKELPVVCDLRCENSRFFHPAHRRRWMADDQHLRRLRLAHCTGGLHVFTYCIALKNIFLFQ